MKLHSYIDKRGWRKLPFDYVSLEIHNQSFPLHHNLSTKVSGLFVDTFNNPYKIKETKEYKMASLAFRSRRTWYGPTVASNETKKLYEELIK